MCFLLQIWKPCLQTNLRITLDSTDTKQLNWLVGENILDSNSTVAFCAVACLQQGDNSIKINDKSDAEEQFYCRFLHRVSFFLKLVFTYSCNRLCFSFLCETSFYRIASAKRIVIAVFFDGVRTDVILEVMAQPCIVCHDKAEGLYNQLKKHANTSILYSLILSSKHLSSSGLEITCQLTFP